MYLLIIILDDSYDLFLESAKIAKYCGKQVFADIGFVFFTLTWVIFRLILFPFYILYFGVYTMGLSMVPCLLLFILCSISCLLVVLHYYWFYFIAVIIYKKLVHGIDVDDEREVEDNTHIKKN